MTHAGLKDLVRGAVVDGQADVDPGDGEVAHDAVLGHVQDFPVLGVGKAAGFGTEDVSVQVIFREASHSRV